MHKSTMQNSGDRLKAAIDTGAAQLYNVNILQTFALETQQ